MSTAGVAWAIGALLGAGGAYALYRMYTPDTLACPKTNALDATIQKIRSGETSEATAETMAQSYALAGCLEAASAIRITIKAHHDAHAADGVLGKAGPAGGVFGFATKPYVDPDAKVAVAPSGTSVALWAGLQTLDEPTRSQALALVAPLDYGGMDGSRPLCRQSLTIDIPRMEERVRFQTAYLAGRPRPFHGYHPTEVPYTDDEFVAWMLGLKYPPGSTLSGVPVSGPLFPDGPLMKTIRNEACPTVGQVRMFRDGVAALGAPTAALAELDAVATRLEAA